MYLPILFIDYNVNTLLHSLCIVFTVCRNALDSLQKKKDDFFQINQQRLLGGYENAKKLLDI